LSAVEQGGEVLAALGFPPSPRFYVRASKAAATAALSS
jgi:hypothetical protein